MPSDSVVKQRMRFRIGSVPVLRRVVTVDFAQLPAESQEPSSGAAVIMDCREPIAVESGERASELCSLM